jgi:hypothetical protein
MEKTTQVQIKIQENQISGKYSNMVQILHSKEEFFFDFLLVAPPGGVLVERIILSPSHAKRLIEALEKNLKMYEDKFGKIESNKEQQQEVGFIL